MELKELMKSLGFTEYETKAYLALLREHPVTGYAVAKNSSVPRSKIYEVLNSLLDKGDIFISDGNPPLYRPLPVKEMIAKRKQAAETSLQDAERTLIKLEAAPTDAENIWNIKGRDAILRKVCECVSEAQTRIRLEVWAEDFPEIEAELKAAATRGVTVQIISYGAIEADFAEVWQHDDSERITEEYGARWIIFSGDDAQVVAGTVSLEEKNQAAWTKHPGLVMPITEVIVHDLYIAELLNAHRDTLEASFGKDLALLRKKFQMSPDFLAQFQG